MATKREQIDFVKKVYPAAYRLCVEKDGVSPVFVTAQAALETGWRIKGIGNNIFGITKGSWTGATALVLTSEVFSRPDVKFVLPEEVVSVTPIDGGKYRYSVYRLFRVYDSLRDCLEDHLSVLRGKGYADAWPYRKDAKEFARRIVDDVGSKYATDPNYAPVMCKVIDMVNMRLSDIRAEISGDDTDYEVFLATNTLIKHE